MEYLYRMPMIALIINGYGCVNKKTSFLSHYSQVFSVTLHPIKPRRGARVVEEARLESV